MTQGHEEKEVKQVYALIVKQALDDASKLKYYEDIYSFFNSHWGQTCLDVLEIEFATIDEKYQITQHHNEFKEFFNQYKIGLKDIELARSLNWDVQKVIHWRRKFKLPEANKLRKG
ncbi:MAG: hypothetical protein PHX61_12755 [Alphaproteobacteria bacterium]|nr:hypothetical protein [Alphaproteobacteria bacterium]